MTIEALDRPTVEEPPSTRKPGTKKGKPKPRRSKKPPVDSLEKAELKSFCFGILNGEIHPETDDISGWEALFLRLQAAYDALPDKDRKANQESLVVGVIQAAEAISNKIQQKMTAILLSKEGDTKVVIQANKTRKAITDLISQVRNDTKEKD